MNISKSRDPVTAMDTISPYLKDNGGIRKSSIKHLLELMKSADHKLIPKCLALNIIQASDELNQYRIIRQGGWDILFQWLTDAQKDENRSFILELMNFYMSAPITMKLLTLNQCPKLIKKLSKSSETDVSGIASRIVQKWRRVIEIQSSVPVDNTDPNVKRKLENDATDDNLKCSEEKKKRPTTVKIPPTHMRTAGLEEESSHTVKSRSEVLSKKGLSESKSPTIDKPLKEIKTQESTDVNLESMHQKIKVQTERRRTSHEMHESSGFIDALKSCAQPALRKKKKSTSKSEVPPKIPKKDDASTPSAQVSPCVKSDDQSKSLHKESTPSNSQENDGMGPKKSSLMDLASVVTIEKKQKKRVSWATADDLISIHFFEMDETERINVNKISVEEMAKKEHLAERQLFTSGKRMSDDSDTTGLLKWKTPPTLEGVPSLEHCGLNSNEKKIQADRESRVLQAIYFTKESVPNSPSEPDLESFEHIEPKVIPLEDVTTTTSDAEANVSSVKQSKNMGDNLLIFQQEGESKMSLNPQIADLVKSLAENYSSGENSKSNSNNGYISTISTTNSNLDGQTIESVICSSSKGQLFASEDESSKDDKMRAELMQLIHKNYPEINISELTVESVRELLEPLKDQLISRNIFALPPNHYSPIPPRFQTYGNYNPGHSNGTGWGGPHGHLRGPIRGQMPPIGPRGLPRQPICQYFMQGSCNKGAACAFLHPSGHPQNHGLRPPPRQVMHRPYNSGRGRMPRPHVQGYRPHHNYS